MTTSVFWVTAVLLVGAVGWTRSAEAAATAWRGDKHAEIRLVTATDRVGAGAIQAGLQIRLAPGWHTYWRDPGEAGIAPTIDWSASDNVATTEIAWPAPSRLVVEGLASNVYEHEVTLPITVGLARPGVPVRLRASVDYAACSDICVPFHADLALDLGAGEVTPSPEAPAIARARARVPGDLAGVGLALVSSEIVPAGAGSALAVVLRSEGEPLVKPELFVDGAGQDGADATGISLGEAGQTARLLVRLPEQGADDSRSPVRITIVDGARAAEFGVPVGSAKP